MQRDASAIADYEPLHAAARFFWRTHCYCFAEVQSGAYANLSLETPTALYVHQVAFRMIERH